VNAPALPSADGEPLVFAPCELAGLGLSPIPIYGLREDGSCFCSKPGECRSQPGKHPVGKEWQRAPTDVEALNAHLAVGQNMGLRMGTQPDSRVLVALDEDEPGAIARAEAELGTLPETLTSRSGGGGQHRIFQWPDGVSPPRNAVKPKHLPGIDVRGEGGQIVIAPSRHVSGRTYQWSVLAPIALLPEKWVEALTPKHSAPEQVKGWEHGVEPRSAEEIDLAVQTVIRVRIFEPGKRQLCSLYLCAYMRKNGWSRDDAEQVITRLCADGRSEKPASHFENLSKAFERPRAEDSGPRGLQEMLGDDGVGRAAMKALDEAFKPPSLLDLQRSLTRPFVDESTRSKKLAICASHEHTDLGNARRFETWLREDVVFDHDTADWYVRGDSGLWLRAVESKIREPAQSVVQQIIFEGAYPGAGDKLKDHARKSQSSGAISSMLKEAPSMLDVAARGGWSSDPDLLCVRNGVLDLRTGVLAEQSGMHNAQAACTFESDAACPLWLRCLEDWTASDAELIAYLQAVAGLCLWGTSTKDLFFLFGPKDSGKSAFIRTIFELLGSYAAATEASDWLKARADAANKDALYYLARKRMAIALEFPANARWNEGDVKRFTGGDPFSVSAKYKPPRTFSPVATLLFGSNYAPRGNWEDTALWRRVHQVPFDHSVPTDAQDKRLGIKLRGELSGILNWALEGLRGYWERGDRLPACEAVERSSAEARADSDTLLEFAEMFRRDLSAFTSNAEAGAAYDRFAQEQRVPLNKRHSPKAISGRLQELGGVKGKLRGVRGWFGLALIDESAVAPPTATEGGAP
jgi:P4 family phage/plasmid primase-like protien